MWPCLAATSDVWLQLAELATVGVPEYGTECALLLDKELEAAVCDPARNDAFVGASRPVCPHCTIHPRMSSLQLHSCTSWVH